MTYSFSLIYWWGKRPRKIILCPWLHSLSQDQGLGFLLSSSKCQPPNKEVLLDPGCWPSRAFSHQWLSRAARCQPLCWLSEKARRKEGWRVRLYSLEGLLSSVGSDVVVEGGGPGEGTTAVATLEGPVTGVSDHVVPQLWRLWKGLRAVTTLVRSETNKETAWSLLSVSVRRNQHQKARAKTPHWHCLRF